MRRWVEAAAPSFPCLVDPEHRVADLFGIINVPSSVWIDEAGRVVRPADVAFPNDQFIDFHGVPAAPQLDALRAWVTAGTSPMDAATARRQQRLPTPADQEARAEFGLAWWLHRRCRTAAADRHFERAGALAPFDWTIRRAALPIRGLDPFGADFAPVFSEWQAAGMPYYPATPRRR